MKKIFMLFVIMIFLTTSCDKPPPGAKIVYRFWIQDNTGQGVTFLVGDNYPDTLVPNSESMLRGVPPGRRVPIDYQEEFEEVFASLPADTLSIFFINSDTLIEYGFSQLRNDYNIIERREISLQDLENNSYTIYFP